jgi:hypothetical protein
MPGGLRALDNCATVGVDHYVRTGPDRTTPWGSAPGLYLTFQGQRLPSRKDRPSAVPRSFYLMALTSRIEIRADEDFIKALEDLSNLTSKNRADVIRDALSLYSIAIKERIYNHKGIVFQDLTTESGMDLAKK